MVSERDSGCRLLRGRSGSGFLLRVAKRLVLRLRPRQPDLDMRRPGIFLEERVGHDHLGGVGHRQQCRNRKVSGAADLSKSAPQPPHKSAIKKAKANRTRAAPGNAPAEPASRTRRPGATRCFSSICENYIRGSGPSMKWIRPIYPEEGEIVTTYFGMRARSVRT
jgi:hypothetical protein